MQTRVIWRFIDLHGGKKSPPKINTAASQVEGKLKNMTMISHKLQKKFISGKTELWMQFITDNSLKIIFTAGKEHISNHINNGKKSTEFMKNVRKWINGSIK